MHSKRKGCGPTGSGGSVWAGRPMAAAWLLAGAAMVGGLGSAGAEPAVCSHLSAAIDFGLPGDLRGTGTVNVADALCATMLSLQWPSIEANTSPPPACLAGSVMRADLNCDDKVDVLDLSLVLHLAVTGAFPSAVDPEGVGCHAACAPAALPVPLSYFPISNFDGSFELVGLQWYEPSELTCQQHGPYGWMPADEQYQTLIYQFPCVISVVTSTASDPIAIGSQTGGDAIGWSGASHGETEAACEAWKADPSSDGDWLYGVTPETIRSSYDVIPFLGWEGIPEPHRGDYVIELQCGARTTLASFTL